LPFDPVPGEPVQVTVSIVNNSTEVIRDIQWSFFTQNPTDAQPSLIGTVTELQPGGTFRASGTYVFGGWGTFATSAFIENVDVQDPNLTNNVSVLQVKTATEPLVIDFRTLPNGREVFETNNLQGNEFQDWNLSIAPSVDPSDTECQSAIARILVDEVEEQWRLITGLPNQSDKCRSQPIMFRLGQEVSDLVPISAAITFVPTAPGVYEVDEDLSALLDSQQLDVTQEDVDERNPQTITVTSEINTGLSRTAIEFSVPEDAITVIQSVTLTPPIQ
jgi:hypothetical protein